MYCPSCGAVLTQQLKFCNRCGSQLGTTNEVELVKIFEKRMDSEMEGLFWVTVFGLAAVFGGSALLKKVQLSEWIIVCYMIVSSLAFMGYFALGVWQVRRLARNVKHANNNMLEIDQPNTSELSPAKNFSMIEGVLSVTENTTRTLEAVPAPTTPREPTPR
jgi:hypothetical protein